MFFFKIFIEENFTIQIKDTHYTITPMCKCFIGLAFGFLFDALDQLGQTTPPWLSHHRSCSSFSLHMVQQFPLHCLCDSHWCLLMASALALKQLSLPPAIAFLMLLPLV